MDVKLIVATGKHIGEKLPVSGPKFIIGRSDECQLRLGSDLISRHHCAIMIEDGYVAVRDFGSKNGTFVNGEQVRSEQELKNGDRLTVGQMEFLVELVVNVSGKKKPKVNSVQEAAARTVESGADELDLASWLAEGETVVANSAHTETQPIPEPLVKQDAAPSAEPPAKEEETKASQPAKPAKNTPTRPIFGNKIANSADSREAAANVLKAFFNRH